MGMNTMVEQKRKKQAHNDSCLVDHVVFDDLPENLVFDILVRLPVETLCSSRLVCKSWFEIISSHDFRNAHLHRSDTTTRGLIFFTPVENNNSSPPKKVFSIESNSMLVDPKFSRHMMLVEIKDGKSTIKGFKMAFNGKIRAACNGLIVLERDPNTAGLILHNPVTRELEDIPLGTIPSWQRDSYGLAFCHVSRRYKLLHLFVKDGLRNNLECEIMDIGGSGSWRAVDVPPTDHFSLLPNPIFAMGALHWIQYAYGRSEFMVSMPLDDEKFKTMALPGGCNFNSIFAMGEFVGSANRVQWYNPQIGVWILRGECGWEKQYNVDTGSELRYFTTPLCYGGDNGQAAFIFKCAECGYLYAYDDSRSQQMRKIEDIDNVADTKFWSIFPHLNSLVSWRRS